MNKKDFNVILVDDSNQITTEETKRVENGKIAANVELSTEFEDEKKKEVFSKVRLFFSPCVFDKNQFAAALIAKGLEFTEIALKVAKAQKEFNQKHKEEIEAAENLNVENFLSKLQNNSTLYKSVLNVLGLKEVTTNVLVNDSGKCVIYSGQNDNDNTRTQLHEDLFVRYENQNTTNLINALSGYTYLLAHNQREFRRINRNIQKKNELYKLLFELLKNHIIDKFTVDNYVNDILDDMVKEAAEAEEAKAKAAEAAEAEAEAAKKEIEAAEEKIKEAEAENKPASAKKAKAAKAKAVQKLSAAETKKRVNS